MNTHGPSLCRSGRLNSAFPTMAWALILAASFVLSICSVPANTWYAGVSGTSTNGTKTSPWSIELAVGQTSNPLLQPGDTVIFLNGGPYVCLETNTANGVGQVLEFRVSGTPNQKITFRAETLWGFSFDGGLLLPGTVSNLVVRDFHIFYSGSIVRVRTNQFTHPPGINELGEGNAILHNLIENTGHPGIGSWKSTRGKHIAGNIIRFTGFDDFTSGYDGANRGSGMYLQNTRDSREALIEGNISYFNYTTGMKAYGNRDISLFNFKNNICAENTEAGIFYHQDQEDSSGFLMVSNCVWNGNPGLRIGYQLGNANPSNAVVAFNYVVDTNTAFSMCDDWHSVAFTNNTGVNPWRRLVWSLGATPDTGAFFKSHQMKGNSYFAGPYTGFGTKEFQVLGQPATLEEWQFVTSSDNDAILNLSLPNRNVVRVLRPSLDQNILHVAVFNWATNRFTTVELAPYFQAGDNLKIYDVQELPVSYTNMFIAGTTVSLDLTRTNLAPMLGRFPQREDAWSGFDPRFRAFVIQKIGNHPIVDSRPLAPSNLRVFGGVN